MNPLNNQITLEQAKRITELIISDPRACTSVFQAERLNNKGNVWQIRRFDVGEVRWSGWGCDFWCTFGARELRGCTSYPMVYLRSFERCSGPIFWNLYATEEDAIAAAFAQGAEAAVRMWMHGKGRVALASETAQRLKVNAKTTK